MAVNFADDVAVLGAYDAIINREANWLLLAYDPSIQPETFHFHSSGANGLSELKSRIEDPLQVFIAFYHDDDVHGGFILINIIPESISGVKRARALVHSRRIGVVFQAHQTTLTVDHLSNLTPKSIRQALASPDSVHVIQVDRVTAMSTDEMGQLADPPATTSSLPPPSKGSVFSLLRRKKKSQVDTEFDGVEPFNLHLEDEDAPPPPPPKDRVARSFLYQPETPAKAETSNPPPPRPLPLPIRTRPRSNSDYTVVSHSSSSSDEVMVVRPDPPHLRSPAIKKRSVTLPSKWSMEPVTAEERSRRRMELQRQREIEEEQALEEEAQRQAEIKLRKEALLRELEEEEEQRRVSVEEEIQYAATLRKQREELERQAEDRKQRELEHKQRVARERRMEEHRRLEQWRKEQAARAEEADRRAEQARRREQQEHKKKIQVASAKAKSVKGNSELLSGWVTTQSGDSLVWRRRYYKFVGSNIFFYRSAKDLTQVLDQLDLKGQVRGLREWSEGYEDLKAIPFSFAVEFNGEREPWSMFTDSEEEKYKLLGLLHANGT